MLLQQLPNPTNVCVIVVTYFPDTGLPDRLSRIKAQIENILIIDNSTSDEAVNYVQTVQKQLGTALMQNHANLGIAAALNQGMEWARQKGFAWVLSFDQDTIPFPGMAAKLFAAYDQYPCKERLAIIGSNHSIHGPEKRTDAVFPPWQEVKIAITSGSLVSVEAFQHIGPYRNEFFIACVDFDFCLKARFKGFKIIQVPEPIMQHFLGQAAEHKFPLRIRTSSYNPWRWYYIHRNYVVLTREYLWKDPGLVLRMLYTQTRIILFMFFWEKSKLQKIKYTALGFFDGLTGISGRVIRKENA